MEITTEAFKYGQVIPEQYTCRGENVAPILKISHPPEKTQSFALIVDDPDAPRGTFDHWIIWNIPKESKELIEKQLNVNQGLNSYGEVGYRGPCPPPGKVHRYYFKLYALDTKLNLKERSLKAEVEKAMEAHILEKAELMGTFETK